MLTTPAIAPVLLSATLPVPHGIRIPKPTPKPRPLGFPPQAKVRWA